MNELKKKKEQKLCLHDEQNGFNLFPTPREFLECQEVLDCMDKR